MSIGYNDIPYSYRDKIKCAHCQNLNLSDRKSDYFRKDTYYCKEKEKYIEMDSHICTDVKADSKVLDDYGTYRQSGCYITTIVCHILGYKDNCSLLNSLRNLRDNYMKKCEHHILLLIEYDQIGPKISENILNDPNNDLVALNMMNRYLIPCEQEINNNNYEAAIKIYVNMVNELKEMYHLNDEVIDYEKEYNIDTLGKARILNPNTN